MSPQWLLDVCISDNKGRFDVGVIASENRPDYIYFHRIRACSGHSVDWLDSGQLYSPFPNDATQFISALCHTTKRAFLMNIFAKSLHPGGLGVAHSGRSLTNLSVFLPDDSRNEVGGWRQDRGYDVTIVFRTLETLRNCNIRVASNGVLATDQVIPSDYIARIFAHKSDRVLNATTSTRWVIYDQLYAQKLVWGLCCWTGALLYSI